MIAGRRVIVVEDDALVRALFSRTLRAEGFDVVEAEDAAACRRHLGEHPAELVVLDLGLPDENGMTLARDLREGGDVGLIVVSRRQEPEQRIMALEIGCDDFMTKPAHLGELCARAHAVIRRRAPRQRVRLDVLTLDTVARTLTFGEQPLGLTRGEFTILGLLVEARGGVVGRDELAAAVSRSAADVDPRTVDALVRRIRRKLEEVTAREIVATVPGVGYRLAVPIAPC